MEKARLDDEDADDDQVNDPKRLRDILELRG